MGSTPARPSAVTATATWDVTRPTLTINDVPARINSTTAFTAEFVFSEDVTGFAATDITVTGGTAGAFAATNATTYTLAVTPTGSANVVVTVAADAATDGVNTGPASAVTATATWDVTRPTLTINDVPARINSTTAFTAEFVFSEDVTGFAATDITVTGGTAGAFAATNATTYTLAVTPTGSANVVVTVAADAATDGVNTGPASAVTATATWDVTRPTLTINDVPARINSTTAFTAEFVFSEDVTGFAATDITVTGGTAGAFAATNATTYTLAVTPTGSANVVVTVAADAATDGVNTGPASAVTATATWDVTRPTLTINDVPARINSTTAFTAEFVFSEDVTGFAATDITVTGGTAGAFAATNATTYTLAVTPTGSANVVVTVAADAATDGVNTGPAQRRDRHRHLGCDPPDPDHQRCAGPDQLDDRLHRGVRLFRGRDRVRRHRHHRHRRHRGGVRRDQRDHLHAGRHPDRLRECRRDRGRRRGDRWGQHRPGQRRDRHRHLGCDPPDPDHQRCAGPDQLDDRLHRGVRLFRGRDRVRRHRHHRHRRHRGGVRRDQRDHLHAGRHPDRLRECRRDRGRRRGDRWGQHRPGPAPPPPPPPGTRTARR